MLVSAVQQCKSSTCLYIYVCVCVYIYVYIYIYIYIYIYPPLLEPPSHCPHSTSLGHHRGAELSLLYNSFPLAICFTHGIVYIMSMPLSQFIPPSPSALCLHVNLHWSKEEMLFKESEILNLHLPTYVIFLTSLLLWLCVPKMPTIFNYLDHQSHMLCKSYAIGCSNL